MKSVIENGARTDICVVSYPITEADMKRKYFGCNGHCHELDNFLSDDSFRDAATARKVRVDRKNPGVLSLQ